MNLLKHLLKPVCLSALLSLMALMTFSITNASAASGIRISCDKDEATVYVDGKVKGNCPVDVKVKEGKHKVVIKKDNGDGSYEYFEKSLLVGDDVVSKVDVGSSFETKYTDIYYWKKKDYQGLLDNFPKSKHAAEARLIISRLEAEKRATAAANEAKTRARNAEARERQRAIISATGVYWADDANIAGKMMNWYEAKEFIASLNNQRYEGYRDWRLPTKEELEALLRYVTSAGGGSLTSFLKKLGFRNLQGNGYWSSSINGKYVWYLNNGGEMYDMGMYANLKVWPVRDGN